MKILYVGDDWIGSNARSLADGFRQAGHDVVVIDTTAVTLPTRFSPSWLYAKTKQRRAPWPREQVHHQIEDAARAFKPDMLFTYKGVHLDQERLLGVPAPVRVHYSPDDVGNPYNTTPEYLAHEAQWDLVVTTKRHNVPELTARGARRVKFVRSAYDPAWHRPCAKRGAQQYLVGFIGARRPDRAGLITRLAKEHGDKLLVHGPGWRRIPALQAGHATVGGAIYGDRFAAAVASVTANLVLLNSDNRDTHTCRTFEIPATGGLFVGERTDEHAELLTEGSECLLFSDEEELRDILQHCARHPDRAEQIAAAGHRRITTEAHRYVDRAREMVDEL
ncbi:glycosyltransferase [Mycobacterium sp. TNTM28]|uniref:Glycosyltransferase n=1 Tax=[Mycobacterium] fortunisiensis TaxID=2600579 RepID=A0ABS6KGN6_9MYCO|nr:glycosyltransferase [[Mycobacterium] fortunisiensis]MBU9762712.1 glycosyltransferase [[Mycobacterium] fortunisiensis]